MFTLLDSVIIDIAGVLTWTPTQNDTGTYEILVIAIDAYALTDTFKLPLVVTLWNVLINILIYGNRRVAFVFVS